MRTKLLLSALVVCAAAWGQEIVLHLDPAQTAVKYTLPATLHTVHGVFKLKRGEIRYNPATGRIAGEVVIDAASGDSQNDGRDRRMHKDILETARYPEIVFTPDRVDGTLAPQGPSHLQVHGLFRIHGADHEITLPVDVRMVDGKPSASAHFTIPYVKWGIRNPSTFVLHVADHVDIDASTGALP